MLGVYMAIRSIPVGAVCVFFCPRLRNTEREGVQPKESSGTGRNDAEITLSDGARNERKPALSLWIEPLPMVVYQVRATLHTFQHSAAATLVI